MTSSEKREAVAQKILTRIGKNTYTQDSRRTQVATGFGDCSATVRWAYLSTLGIEIGTYTQAQIMSTAMSDVSLRITNGVPDEAKMLPGDLLYFRGTDEARYLGVGHVEMYVGDGKIAGHGSGIGPTEKSLKEYCTQMFNCKTNTKYKNRGLIKVRRVNLVDDKPTPAKPNIPKQPEVEKILKGFTGLSIVDGFAFAKEDASLTNRQKWAEKAGIKNYSGTAIQNKALIIALGGIYK